MIHAEGVTPETKAASSQNHEQKTYSRNAGQVITRISSVFGIAIVALPAGIITAGYMKEVSKPDPEGDGLTPADTEGRIRADMEHVRKNGGAE